MVGSRCFVVLLCGPFRWLVELKICLEKPVLISEAFTEVVTDMAAKA